MLRRMTILTLTVAAMAAPVLALSPGTDLVIPAASRGPGDEGSFWVTGAYIHNGSGETAMVDVYWLWRDQANPNPIKMSYTLLAGETLAVDDLLSSDFGVETGSGALRVISDREVVVNSRVSSGTGPDSYGQGFEAIPLSAATMAGEGTRIVGVTHDDDFRTNLIAVDVSGGGTTFDVMLLDAAGTVVASGSYDLEGWEPMLRSLDHIGAADVSSGTLAITVNTGAALFAASKVANESNDATTLESAWVDAPLAARGPGGSYFGVVLGSEGSMDGMTLAVDSDGNVGAVALAYSSEKEGCTRTFRGGGSFSEPVPLDEFADGVTFVNTYSEGGAEMTWVVRLEETGENLYLSGTVYAEGAVWLGADAECNGVHPVSEVHLGKAAPN